MRETLFDWPGRYALRREHGVLVLSVDVRSRRFTAHPSPSEAYAFLMARRRTELLYAIAQSMAAAGALEDDGFGSLMHTCAGASVAELCALAERWNGQGLVAETMTALLGRPLPGTPPRWFARLPRA
ncbi:MAG: hypothetical protein AAF675_11820 [Pseudomonadota bacterium]